MHIGNNLPVIAFLYNEPLDKNNGIKLGYTENSLHPICSYGRLKLHFCRPLNNTVHQNDRLRLRGISLLTMITFLYEKNVGSLSVTKPVSVATICVHPVN